MADHEHATPKFIQLVLHPQTDEHLALVYALDESGRVWVSSDEAEDIAPGWYPMTMTRHTQSWEEASTISDKEDEEEEDDENAARHKKKNR